MIAPYGPMAYHQMSSFGQTPPPHTPITNYHLRVYLPKSTLPQKKHSPTYILLLEVEPNVNLIQH